ncbi:protein SODIUM POTASSIUM ROOT DEFECTIVE 1-like isoform X2 [Vigna unguiculata]|uniref:protein SODIUM POTASSIUM ROOT DEFECTIVE 1-like isoform X2 n=1 Tax=Vigna unguiculata TaxID=3917 RepID=UPI001016176C|nr:protein SODIUM POTASSIUM ROOT DEFECTIVE 1-like isoform X2 [Vigna unguiculata]
MKRMDIFCASQASTAICLSMDEASCSSSSNTILLGGRVIDRHNPIINDSRRSTSKSLTAPCSSAHSPINPKPYHELHKSKKNTSSSFKSAAKGHQNHKNKNTPQHLTNTSASTRSLVGGSSLVDASSSSHYDPVLGLTTPTVNTRTSQVLHRDETTPVSKLSTSSHPKSCSSDQVVVLRVSLHCKGCEGKVRKHLSRMHVVDSMSRSYFLQHRFCCKEGDSCWRCDSIECIG